MPNIKVLFCFYRQKRSITRKRRRHFYFILEKLNPSYGRYTVSAPQINNDVIPNQSYDRLVFKGTLKNALVTQKLTMSVAEYADTRAANDITRYSSYDIMSSDGYDTMRTVTISSDVITENVYDSVRSSIL